MNEQEIKNQKWKLIGMGMNEQRKDLEDLAWSTNVIIVSAEDRCPPFKAL